MADTIAVGPGKIEQGRSKNPSGELSYRLIASLAMGLILPEMADIRRYFPIQTLVYWGTVVAVAGSIFCAGVALQKFLYQKHTQRRGMILHGGFRLHLVALALAAVILMGTTLIDFVSWFLLFDLPVDWRRIARIELAMMITMLVVSKLFLNIYIITDIFHVELRSDQSRLEGSRAFSTSHIYRQAAEGILASLKTLKVVISRDTTKALRYAEDLATVHRYILGSAADELVPLRDEIELLHCHARLLEARFDSKIELEIDFSQSETRHYLIVPISLHLLPENAFVFGRLQRTKGSPNVIRLALLDDQLQMTCAGLSEGHGELKMERLDALLSRIATVIGRPPTVEQGAEQFSILVPLRSISV